MAEVFNGFDVIDKIHDESRQGEAFSLEEVSLPREKQSRKFYIETYGCAMNFSDTEIIASVLNNAGFSSTDDFTGADLILINTCSIRDNAEQKVRKRLTDFRVLKKANPGKLIGVLGCMAERLKSKFLDEEKIVDLVVGPDAYRDLPKLIASADEGEKGVNVLLSREETYADISPVRLNSNGVSAFISITRGCNNMCSFCVVPFTRGRERSREAHSIVAEAKHLFNQGYREVTLLGQNVDSYLWKNEEGDKQVNFAQLLEMVALVNPMLRVRFSTSHPKDLTDDVLFAIIKHHNICNHIHLPVQSGSSSVLERMNRTYDRDWYMERINRIKELIPDCGISTDMIIGFCGEKEEDHLQTVSMMEYVKYNLAYVYKYSERPGTYAAKQFADNVSEEIKSRRLSEIVDLQRRMQQEENIKEVGKEFEVLAEGFSKRSDEFLSGRNSQSKMVIFPKMNFKKGDYVNVRIVSITSATLIGEVIN